MQASQITFAQLIVGESSALFHFHVPKYQREYTWGKSQWEQLLLDIEDHHLGYFMGSIICVQDNTTATPGAEIIYEVVDGQQRLTTLSILLAAIYTKLDTFIKDQKFADEHEYDDIKSSISSIRHKLLKRKTALLSGETGYVQSGSHYYFLRVQPSTQNANLADYLTLLQDIGVFTAGSHQRPPNYGNRLFSRAYKFFGERLPDTYGEITEFLNKINQLQFVTITVSNQADAFALFESLNNRGVPLSAIDIIKNKLLSTLDHQHHIQIDDAYDRWQTVIHALPEADEQERFLRHFYHAFKHLPDFGVESAPRAYRSQMIRIYETLINRDALKLLQNFEELAPLYGKIIHSDIDGPIRKHLLDLNRANGAPVYAMMLYLFTQQRYLREPDFLSNAIKLLVSWVVRRNVTDKPPTRQLDQIFMDLVAACANKINTEGGISFDWFAHTCMHILRPVSRNEFADALRSPLYRLNSGMTRYLLIQIEEQFANKQYNPDLWVRDNYNKFVWTVEHVLPQAENLPNHWVAMIAGGDRHGASIIQAEYVHTLGNLTMSGYNSDLATSPLHDKQTKIQKSFLGHSLTIGYRNGLALNNLKFPVGTQHVDLATITTWNKDTIQARTETIVSMLLDINRLPHD